MDTMTRRVFFFDDLSEKAKEKARGWYREIDDDMPFLEEYLMEEVIEGLRSVSFEPGEDLEVFFSLSYSQGDGVSFSGTITDETNAREYYVTQSGRYYHEYTMDATYKDEEGDDVDADKATMEALRKVAKDAARAGYAYIEDATSNESVDESIRANEYTFTDNGERLDPDNA